LSGVTQNTGESAGHGARKISPLVIGLHASRARRELSRQRIRQARRRPFARGDPACTGGSCGHCVHMTGCDQHGKHDSYGSQIQQLSNPSR
jgi:hypothetical protein